MSILTKTNKGYTYLFENTLYFKGANIMNTQKGLDLEQAFETFVSYAKTFGAVDTGTNLSVLKAAFNKGAEIGGTYQDSIPPKEEIKTSSSRSVIEERNRMIESILKVIQKPVTPSELFEMAIELYNVDWRERSMCSHIQTAIGHGAKIVHVKYGEVKGKYVHSDHAEKGLV